MLQGGSRARHSPASSRPGDRWGCTGPPTASAWRGEPEDTGSGQLRPQGCGGSRKGRCSPGPRAGAASVHTEQPGVCTPHPSSCRGAPPRGRTAVSFHPVPTSQTRRLRPHTDARPDRRLFPSPPPASIPRIGGCELPLGCPPKPSEQRPLIPAPITELGPRPARARRGPFTGKGGSTEATQPAPGGPNGLPPHHPFTRSPTDPGTHRAPTACQEPCPALSQELGKLSARGWWGRWQPSVTSQLIGTVTSSLRTSLGRCGLRPDSMGPSSVLRGKGDPPVSHGPPLRSRPESAPCLSSCLPSPSLRTQPSQGSP